jgi:hypothetical protein
VEPNTYVSCAICRQAETPGAALRIELLERCLHRADVQLCSWCLAAAEQALKQEERGASPGDCIICQGLARLLEPERDKDDQAFRIEPAHAAPTWLCWPCLSAVYTEIWDASDIFYLTYLEDHDGDERGCDDWLTTLQRASIRHNPAVV